jgi:excisionase family DNA binding protein
MAAAAETEPVTSPMLPVPEVARLLGVDHMTVHRLIGDGVIPAGRIVNGKRDLWRVPAGLVLGFLAAVNAGGQVSLDDFAAAWSSGAAA